MIFKIFEDIQNFGEAVVNLFMKLPAWNFTKVYDLAVNLEEIEDKIWIMCQFDRYYSEKCQISESLGK